MARNWSPAHAERAYEQMVASWGKAREAMNKMSESDEAEQRRSEAVNREREAKYPALREG